LENDIILIKDAGFNSIRFAKNVPHPYLLKLCEQYGLLAFIELPVSTLPGSIAYDQSFVTRCKDYISNYLNFYDGYPALVGLGLGSSYLANSESHYSLLSNLAAFVKERSSYITYASFTGFDINQIENLDLFGLEFMDQLVADHSNEIISLKEKLGRGRVIITEATYPVCKGNTDGYVNEHSYEAQAKYFEEFLDFTNANEIAGSFINTMIDYRGNYSSLLSGYNPLNLYNIGIVGEDRNTNRLTYKVVHAKLNNLEKVTIPIGSKRDDAPMVFIIYGLILALFMGVLVNSGRKFREDASRALLRPYNFFADVRDQRIISAYHTTLLGLIIAAVSALIVSNMLFYLKNNHFFEMVLISFGSSSIIVAINFLAWHPFFSILWLTIAGIFLLLIFSLFIKAASLFVKTRVNLISIYFMIIWALLPLVLLIPVGIILYRVLVANVINAYLYIAFILTSLWVLYRLMKGIYVMFDASPGSVYFYSSLCLLVLIGGILFFFELQSSTIQYIIYSLNQFGIIG
jgi:beta-galactosidase